MFIEKIYDSKQSKIKAYPQYVNRASSIGHSCLRYLVYERTRFEEKALHDVKLQLVFDMGNEIERIVTRELSDAGFALIQQQRSFALPEYQLSGHIDGEIQIDDKFFPIEIKSISPHLFETISDYNSLKEHKFVYMRNYAAQMQVYLFFCKAEKGYFLFKNKSTGEYKEVEVIKDDKFINEILDKCVKINDCIDKNNLIITLPEQIEYNENICGRCPYKQICGQTIVNKGVEIIDDDELLLLIEKHQKLKEFVKEYENSNEELTKKLEGREQIIVGNYNITGKWQSMTHYNVPQDIKKQYGEKKEVKFWRKTIKSLGK